MIVVTTSVHSRGECSSHALACSKRTIMGWSSTGCEQEGKNHVCSLDTNADCGSHLILLQRAMGSLL